MCKEQDLALSEDGKLTPRITMAILNSKNEVLNTKGGFVAVSRRKGLVESGVNHQVVQ